eukprot:TRINITY_DN4648_c0_g1_i1.p1 TRINITY_DN4648_c0_g1~~TRINITY_DN4648_c0_g1_i1.p1  ORF type:complete len:586 (+),score=103.54 TRINITY_DN4648_c0_g1_i1:68-1825(+)
MPVRFPEDVGCKDSQFPKVLPHLKVAALEAETTSPCACEADIKATCVAEESFPTARLAVTMPPQSVSDLWRMLAQFKDEIHGLTQKQVSLHSEVRLLLGTFRKELGSPKGEDVPQPEVSPKNEKRRLRECASVLDIDRKPSKSSFGGVLATEDTDTAMLRNMFEVYEEELVGHIGAKYASETNASLHKILRMRQGMSFDLWLDTLVGTLIVLNAVFIGIRIDYDSSHIGWILVDVFFSLVFMVEVMLKLYVQGLNGYFCGPHKASNVFDVSLVSVDLIQFVLDAMLTIDDVDVSGVRVGALLRVVRLGKLLRVIRVLKAKVFNDLLAMLQGMFGGLSTLGWSFVLLMITIYVMALVFRESFGTANEDEVYVYFKSVPRAMFTTFRCSFGDCTDKRGVPILEMIQNEHGSVFSAMYCLFVFFVTIGLFNVISAIFVEATVGAAASLHSRKKKERLRDETRWCMNVSVIIQRLLERVEGHSIEGSLSDNIDDIYLLDVPNDVIDDLVSDDIVVRALNNLDIDHEDRDYLSEILDPDHGGTINVIELVEGLRRLRGEPRRSDIVTVNLILRNIQLSLAEISQAVKAKT